MDLTLNEYEVLYGIVERGLRASSQALSTMTTGGIQLHKPSMEFIPLTLVPSIAGGPEVVAVSVYLRIEGDIQGHLMILFTSESALRVVDMLMDYPPGTTQSIDALAASALAETGNVCGTAFLNALADRTGMTILPTTPAVVIDMAGAILESVVSELFLNGDEVLLVETSFNADIPGAFLLMPDQESMARLIAALESTG